MCVRARYIPRCASTISLPLALSSVSCSRTARTYAGVCMREFRNEQRIYGLAGLDSIPFASSPAIPLDFVRLQTAPLSDPRLPERARSLFLNNSCPLLRSHLGSANATPRSEGFRWIYSLTANAHHPLLHPRSGRNFRVYLFRRAGATESIRSTRSLISQRRVSVFIFLFLLASTS